MRFTHSAIAAAVAVAIAGPAAADFKPLSGGGSGNPFGDDRLSYQNGVVYDDDLVPGLGPNQPFYPQEQAAGTVPPAPRPSERLRSKALPLR